MAKHNSPMRIEASLVNSAALAGSVLHRSAAEQIEMWASIGEKVAANLTPKQLLGIHSGLMEVTVVEKPSTQYVDPMSLFEEVNSAETKAALSLKLKNKHRVAYSASKTQHGLLERIMDGEVEVGQFRNGVFEVQK